MSASVDAGGDPGSGSLRNRRYQPLAAAREMYLASQLEGSDATDLWELEDEVGTGVDAEMAAKAEQWTARMPDLWDVPDEEEWAIAAATEPPEPELPKPTPPPRCRECPGDGDLDPYYQYYDCCCCRCRKHQALGHTYWHAWCAQCIVEIACKVCGKRLARSGRRCDTCRKYVQRTGRERPRHLIDRGNRILNPAADDRVSLAKLEAAHRAQLKRWERPDPWAS